MTAAIGKRVSGLVDLRPSAAKKIPHLEQKKLFVFKALLPPAHSILLLTHFFLIVPYLAKSGKLSNERGSARPRFVR